MPKPKVLDLNLSDEQVEELNQILMNPKMPKHTRVNIVRQDVEGLCCSCSRIPNKLVCWELDGIELIERYCSECFENNKKRILSTEKVI